jgi:hypothetical protein
MNNNFRRYLNYVTHSTPFILFEIIGFIMVSLGVFISHKRVIYSNIGLIICAISIFFNLISEKKISFSFNKNLLLLYLGIVLIYIISMFLNNEGFSISILYLRNQFLWIAIPLAICLTKYRGKKLEAIYVYALISLIEIILLTSLYNYFFNYKFDPHHPNVLSGVNIPFEIQHHMFAIILNGVNIFIYDLFLKLDNGKKRFYKNTLLLVLVLNIFSIHLIGSRIGILVVYFCIFYIVITRIKSFKYFHVFFILFLLSVLLVFTYFFNKDFKSRIQETMLEIKYISNSYKRDSQEVKYLGAFTARLISYEDNIVLIKENFWKGIGLCKFQEKMELHFEGKYAENDYIHRQLPPNLWIRYCISMGVPFTLLLFIFFHLFLLFNKNYKSFVVLLVFLGLSAYCMTESPLEYTMPLRYFIMITGFTLRYKYLNNA